MTGKSFHILPMCRQQYANEERTHKTVGHLQITDKVCTMIQCVYTSMHIITHHIVSGACENACTALFA